MGNKKTNAQAKPAKEEPITTTTTDTTKVKEDPNASDDEGDVVDASEPPLPKEHENEPQPDEEAISF